MLVFYLGQELQLGAEFADAVGEPVDPAVVMSIRTPDGVTETFTYGVDAELTRVEAGSYRLLYLVTEEGLHDYRIETTDEVYTAEEGQFRGARSVFV
jgi:hypothetical protein